MFKNYKIAHFNLFLIAFVMFVASIWFVIIDPAMELWSDMGILSFLVFVGTIVFRLILCVLIYIMLLVLNTAIFTNAFK